MKRLLIVIACLVLIGIAIFFVVKSRKKENTSHTDGTKNELPYMMVLMEDGSQVQMKDVKENTILILYQPECDHCQREARAIRDHMDAFNNYTLYFVTTETFQKIDKFVSDQELNGLANVHFGKTQFDYIINNFGQISAPSIYIYSSSGKLIKHFNGETPIEMILNYL